MAAAIAVMGGKLCARVIQFLPIADKLRWMRVSREHRAFVTSDGVWSPSERSVLYTVVAARFSKSASQSIFFQSALVDKEPNIRQLVRSGLLKNAPVWYLALRHRADVFTYKFHVVDDDAPDAGERRHKAFNVALQFHTLETTPVAEALHIGVEHWDVPQKRALVGGGGEPAHKKPKTM